MKTINTTEVKGLKHAFTKNIQEFIQSKPEKISTLVMTMKTKKLKRLRHGGMRMKATHLLYGTTIIISEDDYCPCSVYDLSEWMHMEAVRQLMIKLDKSATHREGLRGIKIDPDTYIWTRDEYQLYAEVENSEVN